MIQYFLKDVLDQTLTRPVTITVDYEPDLETYMTVFYEGPGGQPDPYDRKLQRLRYMVWIESEDWGLATYLAREVYLALHEYAGRPVIEVEYFDKDNVKLDSEFVLLLDLDAAGEPNPLGIEEGKRRFSVNFDAILTTIKEETTNG